MRTIPKSEWGQDHWSLLLYIETRAVDHKGNLSRLHLRCESAALKHPTRLREGTERGHTDLHALDDLEAAKLIQNIGTGLNPKCRLTNEGWKEVGDLRRYKAGGGTCSGFAKLHQYCAMCDTRLDEVVTYTIHRDGMDQGPEVPLCTHCGSGPSPSCEEIWEAIRKRREGTSNVSV